MHVILYSFTYPLKPLTQAPISIIYATHNHVLPNPDASHPEFFSADIPPRCLASGILPRQRSTLSGCLTSGILPCQRSTLSGCLTSEILLRRHSTRMSHTRNSAPPTFNIPPRYLTFGILPGQRSTFSGYLTSGILSVDIQPSPDISLSKFCPADVPPFSSSLEHFL